MSSGFCHLYSDQRVLSSDEKADSPVVQQSPSPPLRPISGAAREVKRKEQPRRLKQQRKTVTVGDKSERIDQASETATQITVLERKANDPLHASSSILRVSMSSFCLSVILCLCVASELPVFVCSLREVVHLERRMLFMTAKGMLCRLLD
jgi:hypothetical protein